MRSSRSVRRFIGSGLLLAIMVAAPRAALACPVCFGQSDSKMAVGTNMAIFFMLGLTGAVLAAFGAFIVYLIRRARLFNTDGPDHFGSYPPFDTGPYDPAQAGHYPTGTRF
jgi:hypothetical protein